MISPQVSPRLTVQEFANTVCYEFAKPTEMIWISSPIQHDIFSDDLTTINLRCTQIFHSEYRVIQY